MDKLAKIEELINRALTLLINKVKKVLLILCPKFIPSLYHKCINIITNLTNKLKYQLSRVKKVSIKELPFIKKALHYKQLIFNFPLQDKVNEQFLKFKETPLENHRQWLIVQKNRIVNSLADRFGRITNQQFAMGIILCLFLGLGSLSMFYSGNSIYKKEFVVREPASVVPVTKRAPYRHFQKKSLKVFNVKIPLFVEKVSAIKTITIDFNIRTSNRFTKKYLAAYEYKLKDYFFTTVEPVVSTFPLKEEGKLILKEKIRIELNEFLKENRVEGEVDEVEIIFIIGS